jgi:hypothetical protein
MRYESVNGFLETERIGSFVIEVADARDKRDGHVYRDGCYRVSGPGIRTKRWYGEVAWADATRYANDADLKLRSQRWDRDRW